MASPVGHAAVGIAAAAVVARVTATPDSTALWAGAVIASGIPDLDVALPLLGFPKRLHRNATHSLLFVTAVILLGVAVIRWLGLHPPAGMLLAWVAALITHPLLDVVTSGPAVGRAGWGIPLLWPFSRRRFYLRRPLLVSDRPESHTLRDLLGEAREDALRIVPVCALVVLVTRLLG